MKVVSVIEVKVVSVVEVNVVSVVFPLDVCFVE